MDIKEKLDVDLELGEVGEKNTKPKNTVKTETVPKGFETETDKMILAGLHFGHKKNKKHPKMQPYIHGVRNGINIIDLGKTEEKLQEALAFIKTLISESKVILVVGTKVQLSELVKSFANECNLPYITERWLGGTFTNFDNIKKRVDYLKGLEKKETDGELEKYTKKERLDISREIESLKVKFEGLKSLTKLPDAIFVIDVEDDSIAVKEAIMKNVKIIAITDTNVNPELVDYPIPGNDDAVSSVKYILNRIKEVIINTEKKPQKEEGGEEKKEINREGEFIA